MKRKRDLEKNNVRWTFKIDFCIFRYLIKKTRINKLTIEWRIRARKYDEKMKEMEDTKWMKIC